MIEGHGMNFKILSKDLKSSLKIIAKGVGLKDPKPFTDCILFNVSNNILTLSSTNSTILISNKTSCEGIEEGAVLIPALNLLGIMSKIHDDIELEFKSSDNVIILKGPKFKYKLNTYSSDYFPAFPKDDDIEKISISGSILKKLLSSVLYCCAGPDETLRPEMQCVHFALLGGLLTLEATDSKRLTQKTHERLDGPSTNVLLPAISVAELIKILSEEETFLFLNKNKTLMIFESSSFRFETALFQKTYPCFNSIMPKEYKTSAEINRKEFLDSLKRLNVLACQQREGISGQCRICVGSSSILLDTVSNSGDDACEEIPASIEGIPNIVCLNPFFVIQALEYIKSENIILKLIDDMNIASIIPKDDPSSVHAIMVIRLKDRVNPLI